MATVFDIGNEEAFKSKTDIIDFNNRNFPHQPLQTATIEVCSDAMASLRSQMKKRVYVFNQADKESSSMKVAELRNKFIGIKSRIEDARNNQRSEHAKPSYLKLLRELENDADLITNIEGRLLWILEGQADETLLMNRPMNKRLVDTLDSIVDKEKKMQAIIFEFLPDLSKTKAAHISMIDQIEDQVSDIEQVIGKTSRMTHFTFELQGHNMLSAMNQMEAWIQPYISESKFSDRKFDEMNNRVKAINELLKKKIGNNPITLQQIKEMKDLYELYKGLFKYDSLIDRSLTLTRTHERLTILRENRPFDMTYSEQMSSDIRRDTDILKHRIAKVSSAMRDQFNNINAKMVELENSVKSLL